MMRQVLIIRQRNFANRRPKISRQLNKGRNRQLIFQLRHMALEIRDTTVLFLEELITITLYFRDGYIIYLEGITKKVERSTSSMSVKLYIQRRKMCNKNETKVLNV
jgi:hypothetical protein